jgi:CheY-like chemotaxis protein
MLMNVSGPIVFIEDDLDDQEIIAEAFKTLNLPNKVIFFSDGEKALQYLTETDIKPFIIFSDINMPRLSGMDLRKKVHENEDLRLKSIPYLFFTTSAEQKHVIDAYSKSVQGFFVKPSDFNELKDTLQSIVDYWQRCVSPNYVK